VTKAATAVTTDLGQFTALAAAWTVDRQGERIARGAFSDTIQRWSSSGKAVPIHWNHKGEASNVIGSVDPASMKETEQGLYVEGQLDIEDSDTAREVWRSVKRGRVSLSFGFLVKAAHDEGDVHVLDEIDLFEVSIVAAPANEDTRIISTKAIHGQHDRPRGAIAAHFYDLMMAPLDTKRADSEQTNGVPTTDELLARAKALGIDPRPIEIKTYEVD
jgi:HK97 family phage prohead protease